jgi:hypothetical protein
VPISEVSVEQFDVKVTSEQGRSMSTLENYVYVEGAVRYLGKGAYPFWSMPDATHPTRASRPEKEQGM